MVGCSQGTRQQSAYYSHDNSDLNILGWPGTLQSSEIVAVVASTTSWRMPCRHTLMRADESNLVIDHWCQGVFAQVEECENVSLALFRSC